MNDKKKIEYGETRVCKKCGRELPIEKFAINGKKYYRHVCKECENANKREWWRKRSIRKFMDDESMKIHRKYKTIRQEKILSLDECGITPIADDEVFVRLLDYRTAWVSNYSRVITQYGKKFALMHKKTTKTGEVAYQLYRNVYDGEKWTYEKRLVEAWKLVVQEFIVNYDMANNTCCWHKGNNKEDNYYKNLYPLNEKQYNAVSSNYLNSGDDIEETIFEIINNLDYKADNWTPRVMKRSVCGIGYLGRTGVDTNSLIYRKWVNMMQRCYYDKVHEQKPYYADCTVCEEWLNFSNFEIWYNENHIEGKKFDLDKDILVQGNTEYSPDTCALISHYTNTVFEDRGMKSNIVENKDGKFDTSMTILGKKVEIGVFDTEEIARQELFENRKNYITQFAIKSKNKVPNKVYQAMMNWKIRE